MTSDPQNELAASTHPLARLAIARFDAFAAAAKRARKAKSDKREAIHKLRVASRRLEAALAPLEAGELSDADESRWRKLRQTVRKTRKRCGLAHDPYIMATSLDRLKMGCHSDELAAIEYATRQAQRTERREFRSVRRSLQELRFGRRRKRLVGLPWDRLPNNLIESATAAARLRFERQMSALHVFGLSQSDPTAMFAALHRARIAGKKYRYLIELSNRGANGSPSGSADAPLRQLKETQKRLGAINDLAVLADQLGILRQRAVKKAAVVRGIDRLLGRIRAEALEMARQFLRARGDEGAA